MARLHSVRPSISILHISPKTVYSADIPNSPLTLLGTRNWHKRLGDYVSSDASADVETCISMISDDMGLIIYFARHINCRVCYCLMPMHGCASIALQSHILHAGANFIHPTTVLHYCPLPCLKINPPPSPPPDPPPRRPIDARRGACVEPMMKCRQNDTSWLVYG